MHGEIIAIGDELVAGRVRNTTSSFAAGQLFQAGYRLDCITIIGDDAGAIKTSLLTAVGRSAFVIVTGGLGPTSDDMTSEAVAAALGRGLVLNKEVLKKIEAEKGRWGGTPDRMLEKLAMLPDGAEFLNPDGRAAGYLIIERGVFIFCLPGVPDELEYLFMNQVIPRLNNAFGSRFAARQRTFKTFGLQETEINALLEWRIRDMEWIKIGYYPSFPEVFITISMMDPDNGAADRRFASACSTIEAALAENLIGADEDTQESMVGKLLLEKGATLAVAESCTGGLLAHRITSVAGSSLWFERGVVSYSNRSKEEMLGVLLETIANFGAVSRNTGIEMADGAKRIAGSTYSIAVTGFAGPGGGTPHDPVGTVYIAIGAPESTFCQRFSFQGSRCAIQTMSAETALDWLRRYLKYDADIYSH